MSDVRHDIQHDIQHIRDRDGNAHTFPPPVELDWPVVDGRIQTRSLEAHIVDHCNLTCAECCSLSPLLPRWFVEPEALARDLRLARRALAPRIFKLVGGEPLLHPRLVGLMRVARDSGIAPVLSLTTNGFLLPTMSDAFWEELDALTISLYPVPALSEDTIVLAKKRAVQFGVTINWKEQNAFVRMNRVEACADATETKAIYDRCWLRGRCHMVRDGRFYTCTRPPHFHGLLGRDFAGDGLALHEGRELVLQILTYLKRPQPLDACAHCYGGDAAMTPHRLMTRAEIQAGLTRAAEESPPAPASTGSGPRS